MTGPLPPSGPPAPPASPTAAPAPVPIAEVLLATLPDKLQNLQRPVLLPGTVAGQTPEGLVQVRTQAGDVLIRIAIPLQTNQSILLQILAGTPPTQATAFAPQGNATAPPAPPPPGAANAPAVALDVSTPAATPPQSAAPLALRPGMVLPAITLAASPGLTVPGGMAPSLASAPPPPIGAQSLPGGLLNLLPGGMARTVSTPPTAMGSALETGARLAQPLGSPLPPSAAQGAATPVGSSAPQVSLDGKSLPLPPAGAPPSPGPPPMPVQAGSTIALKVLDVRPADGAQPPAAMPETGADGTPILTGTVARNNAHGQPILATPRGTFLLATPLPVQQGTQMTVALTDPAQILAAGLPHGEDEAGGGKGWPDFQRALATLAAIDPAMAQALVNTVMPQPNRKLGTALMFFLSAARGGDARGWLGDEAALTLEKSGRRDVLTALTEEFRAMARQAADTPPGEWKPYLIPFLAGETVARLSLHVRPVGDEDGQKGGRDKEGRGSRFLLDVDLSRLGPIQLDGLVRPRRFDLILRSRIDLPEEVRHDLPTIFTNCLETVGYTGALSFQSGGRGWVSVQPKPSRGLGPHGAGVSA